MMILDADQTKVILFNIEKYCRMVCQSRIEDTKIQQVQKLKFIGSVLTGEEKCELKFEGALD